MRIKIKYLVYALGIGICGLGGGIAVPGLWCVGLAVAVYSQEFISPDKQIYIKKD